VKPPVPTACLILRVHFGSIRKVCASRTFVLNSPLWGLWSPQGDRPVRFVAARRRARGSACKTRPGKSPRTPLIARAKPAAAAIRRKRHRRGQSPSLMQTVTLRAAGVQNPAVPLRVRRPRGLRKLARRWGRPSPRASRSLAPPWNPSPISHRHRVRHGCSHRRRSRPTCSQPRPALRC